jgi:glycerol kinase
MGSQAYVLAIDQGTTSTRAILFDRAGRARVTAQTELTQHHPRPGWVEHDPEEIWRSVVSTCREAITAADGPIAAIGIANQRETTVLWERATGRPVHNAIVWRDRRTAELCERWRAAGLAETVAARTGLIVDPYFSASKIRWLLDSVPGLLWRARAGEIAFGTIDAFLLWRLTGGQRHATDVTNASRTMLFDIGSSPGTRNFSTPLASRWHCSPKCWTPVPITARPRGTCSARRFRSRQWSATSRRRRSARPVSRPA